MRYRITKMNVAQGIIQIFTHLEVVGCYRDPQLQVGENYLYLFSLRPNILLHAQTLISFPITVILRANNTD